MIAEKTTLQEKFNKIPGADVGMLLQFDNEGELKVVSQTSQGIQPQIKVLANSGASVLCTKSGSGAVTASANYPATTWYFNTPGLGTYTVSVTYSGTTRTYEQQVTAYKQYTVNGVR